jgi:1,4-dihydroxy-2-naphthoyl-CoA synthase
MSSPTPTFETILYSVEDHIATITLHRPERMNAWTLQMCNDLQAAFDLTDDYFMLLQVIQGHEDLITDFLILEANQSACATMFS